jgi:hypothetical protein
LKDIAKLDIDDIEFEASGQSVAPAQSYWMARNDKNSDFSLQPESPFAEL